MDAVFAIVNAAAGSAALPALPPEWTRLDVQEDEDPAGLVQTALAQRARLVVAVGGDGTANGVARGLAGTGVPMAVVPTGTANVFAAELGVPSDPEAALALATGDAPGRLRTLDVGRTGEHVFLLRLSLGVEATMVTHADADFKARWGRLAYAASLLRELRTQRPVRYRLVLNGRVRYARGISCVVCNSANPGLAGVQPLPRIRPDDGRLDVVVLRGPGLRALASMLTTALRSVVRGQGLRLDRSPALAVWPARTVEVSAHPSQEAACDGEPITAPTLRAEVWPGALQVRVPA